MLFFKRMKFCKMYWGRLKGIVMCVNIVVFGDYGL